MDPNTGRIYEVKDEEDAKKRGLIPIPKDEYGKVVAMNRKQRRAWAAQQRRKQVPGG
jgi:hypothetical protein